jgi:2-isopropylmalate synthase
VQKLARSYEHMEPSLVGNAQTILVSDMSGQSNILAKAKELGFDFQKGAPEVAAILRQVKESEAAGYEFEAADASFDLLVRRTLGRHRPLFDLREYHCSFRRSPLHGFTTCEATVKLHVNDVSEYTVEEGDGPVDALDAALRKALRPFYSWIDDIRLADYKVRIVDGSRGAAARTPVLIVSTDGHSTWGTVAVSDYMIESSWLALVDSIEFNGIKRQGA